MSSLRNEWDCTFSNKKIAQLTCWKILGGEKKWVQRGSAACSLIAYCNMLPQIDKLP